MEPTKTKPKTYEAAVLEMLGDPRTVDRDLQAFHRSARILSSKRRHLIAHYPKRWVGIYGDEVAAQAPTLPLLIEELEKKGVPRGRAIVRYIVKNPRKMIL